MHLEPLVGEDPEVFQIAQTDPMRLFDDAPTLATRSLLAALSQQRWDVAWSLLSERARADVAAKAGLDVAQGPRIFSDLATRGQSVTHAVFGQEPTRVTTIPPEGGELEPPSPFVPADGIITVYAYDANGASSAVKLRFENDRWKLEQVLPAPAS